MDEKTAMEYAEQFTGLIPELIRTARNQEAKRLARYSLTIPQFFALATLKEKGPCMMREMGEELALTLGTVTGIIDRLARGDLVERYADGHDRRIVMIKLTLKGRKLIERIHQDRVQTLSQRLQGMEKEEIATFAELLGKVGAQLAREDI